MTTIERDQDLREVEVGDVYKAGLLAAHLTRGPAGVEFGYDAQYIDDGGPAVATTLPVTDAVITFPAGAVPPYFAGLLPEGRRLVSLRRAVKTSADDELTLLLAVGRDAIGDVQVAPAGADLTVGPLRAEVDRSWSEIRFRDVLADAGMIDPVALPGVQDKVSARMISVPVKRRGERFILKVDPPELRHLVANEAYFLARARRARLDAAQAEVIRDADDRPGLLVRRFDRRALPDGATTSLACEDGGQVMGRWPADKYNVTTEEVVLALADRCVARPVALRSLFQQLCFAWLTGNGDVHAKNLSILADDDGEWRVSPAYDLPCTVAYGDLTMALPMVGRRGDFARRHLLEFADAIGLPGRAAVKVLDDLVDRLADLEDEVRSGALPFDDNTRTEIVKELRHRHRQAAAPSVT